MNLVLMNVCAQLPLINEILKPLFKTDVFTKEIDRFGFGNIKEYCIFNSFEAQIDTGNMMQDLLKKAVADDILILNQQTVTAYVDTGNQVEIQLNDFSFISKKVLFTTNGFANALTEGAVQPARAQVLITEPIAKFSDQRYFSYGSRLLLL